MQEHSYCKKIVSSRIYSTAYFCNINVLTALKYLLLHSYLNWLCLLPEGQGSTLIDPIYHFLPYKLYRYCASLFHVTMLFLADMMFSVAVEPRKSANICCIMRQSCFSILECVIMSDSAWRSDAELVGREVIMLCSHQRKIHVTVRFFFGEGQLNLKGCIRLLLFVLHFFFLYRVVLFLSLLTFRVIFYYSSY
jgi:hypothetical protein